MKISKDCVVTLKYQLKTNDGRVLENRSERNPFVYLHGYRAILAGLETKLNGKTTGHQGSYFFSEIDGYGPHRADLVAELPRAKLPKGVFASIGTSFATQGPEGEDLIVRIISFDNDKVVLDGNHPLAGVALNFDVEVLDVREATEDEIRQQRPLSNLGKPGGPGYGEMH